MNWRFWRRPQPPPPAERPLTFLNETGCCPVCTCANFSLGPQGGAAMNIRCAVCHQCYWFAPPFTPQKIEDVGEWAYPQPPVNLWREMHGRE